MAIGNTIFQTLNQIRVSTYSSFSCSKSVSDPGKVMPDESV